MRPAVFFWASEAALFAQVIDQRNSNEISYFIGLRAKTEGRYRNAAGWFWLTMGLDTMDREEARWARDQL